MTMTVEDALQADGLLLTRIAMLERRLQALTRVVLEMRGTALTADGLAAQVVIEPDCQRELAAGFHEREHDAAGRPFRWAGRTDHFELRFHLDRFSARTFRMVGQFAAGVAPETLRGFVDYRSIPLTLEAERGQGGGRVVVVGRIPADPLGGAATLTFHCPAVASPNPADLRRLSFAFVRLEAGGLEAGEAAAVRAAA